MIEETYKKFEEAIKFYQKAIINSFNNEKITEYKADIERCQTKMEIK